MQIFQLNVVLINVACVFFPFIGVSINIADWRGSDCISVLGGQAKGYLVERGLTLTLIMIMGEVN